MLAFILRRTLLAVPVTWGAMSLLFLMFFVVPGDPVEQIVGSGRAISPAVRENIERKLGLDQPWYVQYGRYWQRVATGDLGRSYQSDRSVNEVVKEAAPASVRLAVWAMLIEIVVGLSVGVVSAAKRYSFIDTLTTVSTTMLVAVPVFVLGYILQIMLGVYTFQHDFPAWARFPVQGIGPDSWAFLVVPTGSQWRYLLLPVLTLASVSTAVVARLMRTTMLEVDRADYMRTAMAKGLRHRRAVLKHGLKNAMVPVVTFIGIDLATLIGSAILTETVFNWPGLGSRIAGALGAHDAPIVLGLSLVVVLAYVVINLVVDVSYAFFDPRIRYGGGR
jgi:ABC-type dipeptide/oligopeptide/nickel transport system permease component